MLLDRAARVYVEWTITSDVTDLGGPFEVWLGGAWQPAELLADPARLRLLVAGPDVPADGLGDDATVLQVGLHAPRIRVADNPEIVVAAAGTIVVA